MEHGGGSSDPEIVHAGSPWRRAGQRAIRCGGSGYAEVIATAAAAGRGQQRTAPRAHEDGCVKNCLQFRGDSVKIADLLRHSSLFGAVQGRNQGSSGRQSMPLGPTFQWWL